MKPRLNRLSKLPKKALKYKNTNGFCDVILDVLQ